MCTSAKDVKSLPLSNITTSTSVFGNGCISTHADPTRGQHDGRIGHRTGRTRIARGPGRRAVRVARALADSSDFRLLGKQSSPKCEIPSPGRRQTTVQNLTPLVLSSAEKSSTVQTHKQNYNNKSKQTVTDISTPCLSACVDKKTINKCS